MPADGYQQGVDYWVERELYRAVEVLERELISGTDHNRWFSVSRALAQIALEGNHVELARGHLRRLPGDGVGDALQQALRARCSFQERHFELCASEISVAVSRLFETDADDAASLMNGAIALAWCGDLLVEMGFGEEAGRLVAIARERVARTGIDDVVLVTMLDLTAVGTLRLAGDLAGADDVLTEVDPAAGRDLAILRTLEKARLARARGESRVALAFYEDALEACLRDDYSALARMIDIERETDPPPARVDPDPVERWALRSMRQALSEETPYALVLRIVNDGDRRRFVGLEQQVRTLLAESPDLGTVDGSGGDDLNWELFLDGDDPMSLWMAIGPVVLNFDPSIGSEAIVRQGPGTITLPIR